VMAIVEIDTAGPAARDARDQLLDNFGRFFAEAPPLPDARLGQEVVHSIVGGIYSTIRRHVAAGHTADLGALLPSISYFLMVPFLGREAAEEELRAPPETEKTPSICSTLDPVSTER
jgi:hypothetical protein